MLRFALPLLVLTTSLGPASARPNVVFLLADDLGWGDLSCYGSKQVETPNLDRLAKDGIRFTQFYVASPICSPSRVGFMTGAFPARWRVTSYLQARAGNKYCEQADWLDVKAPFVARGFQAAGYATAHFGKWHLGGGRDVQDAPAPKEYGFDEHHVNFEGTGPRFETEGLREPGKADGKEVPRHAMTAYWTDRTIDFIKRNKGKPFYVNLWPQDTHTAHAPSEEQLKLVPDGVPVPQRKFRAVLKELDRQVGRLLDALKELGLDENTLVLFSGDNGPEPSFDRARTGGLRGMKWSLYEGGLRTPLLARCPALLPAGKVNDATVIAAVDLFPTLCKLCGVEPPKGATFDGEDLSAAFKGDKVNRTKLLFWEYGRKPPTDQKGLGPFPYPKEPDAKSPNVAVRDGKWKLLVNADGTGAELYDLSADPKEAKDLAAAQPDVAERLRKLALEWRKSLP